MGRYGRHGSGGQLSVRFQSSGEGKGLFESGFSVGEPWVNSDLPGVCIGKKTGEKILA
jgi:hypothetical protein